MRTEHAKLTASAERTAQKLERTELQLEGLKTTHAELEKKYAESEGTVASLTRQVEKWTALESRENADLENLRKARIELEIKVKQLETETERLETERAQEAAKAEKLKSRLEKWKEGYEAHSVRRIAVFVHEDHLS